MNKVFESRSYQTRIHDKAIEYLINPNNNGVAKTVMIESPTGSGKTVMGMRLAKHLEEQGHKVGWIAHRKELLEQAKQCNQDFFQVKDIKFISLFTRQAQKYADRTVVVVDEAQHDAAKSASVLHDVIRPDIILGLTATPYRADRAQLCFQKVIRDAGIHQLIREGFLAEYNSYIYDREWTPDNIANLFINDQAKWGKSVIYFLTKDDAKACAKILLSEGIRADYIVGDEPREEALLAFRRDELDVLTNVAVLTEGFDEPSLKTAFVRPSSKGPTVQMAGRAFRKHPDIPVCNIVQDKETKYPFTRHATAYGQYVMREGEWRSVDPKNLKPFFEKQRKRIAQAVIDIPAYLKNRDKERFSSFDE